MSTTVDGVIRLYPPMEQGVTQSTGQPWYKQLMVIETYGQYPKKVAIAFMGADKINALQQFPVGTAVKVHVNLESREYNGKWYDSINGWKVEHGSATQQQPAAAPMAPAAPAQQAAPAPQQYAIGSVVNGFQLHPDGQWKPYQPAQAAPVQAPASAPMAPAAPAPMAAPGAAPMAPSPAQNAGANPAFFTTDPNDIPF